MIIHEFSKEDQESMLEELNEREKQAYLLRKNGKLSMAEYHTIWTNLERRKRDISSISSIAIKVNNDNVNKNSGMTRKLKK